MGQDLADKVWASEDTLLTNAHRRWIETRDPKDGDHVADLVQYIIRERKRRAATTDQSGGER